LGKREKRETQRKGRGTIDRAGTDEKGRTAGRESGIQTRRREDTGDAGSPFGKLLKIRIVMEP
jgi:hypothetical protein